MTTYDDIMAIEGEAETAEEFYEALQRQINSGQIWLLQGSAGRTAMDAIQNGYVMLGREMRRDYWGNVVPPRHAIKAGEHGSRDFVADVQGEEWAERMEAVE